MLLLRQWKVGYIPADLDSAARCLRLSSKELKPHWDTLRAKFRTVCLIEDRREVLVNSRLDAIYAKQLAAYLERKARNAANGRNGGRPKKPKENPVGSQSDTQPVASGNPQKTREKKREKRTPSEVVEDKSPTKGAAPAGLDLKGLGEVMDLAQPFGKCYATLYLLHQNMGQSVPPFTDAVKHVKGTTGLLGLASELGPESAADLIAWVFDHNPGGKSLSVIYQDRAGLLRQMANGVAWVPRRNAAVTGNPATPKPGLADALGENPWRDDP